MLLGNVSPSMFVGRFARTHRLAGLALLLWLLLGAALLLTDAQLSSRACVAYDAVLGALGVFATASAASDFRVAHARVCNLGFGTLNEAATVTHAEMLEHVFYQVLNLVQVVGLHGLGDERLAHSLPPCVALLLLMTSPWLARGRFPVNRFSDNYTRGHDGQALLSGLYFIKKSQYLLYKHALLHGLNVSTGAPGGGSAKVRAGAKVRAEAKVRAGAVPAVPCREPRARPTPRRDAREFTNEFALEFTHAPSQPRPPKNSPQNSPTIPVNLAHPRSQSTSPRSITLATFAVVISGRMPRTTSLPWMRTPSKKPKHSLRSTTRETRPAQVAVTLGGGAIATSRPFRVYCLCLNTSYVMEFFLQTLVKKGHLGQLRMLALQQLLMAISSAAATQTLWRHTRLVAAAASLALNLGHRHHELANTATTLSCTLAWAAYVVGD